MSASVSLYRYRLLPWPSSKANSEGGEVSKAWPTAPPCLLWSILCSHRVQFLCARTAIMTGSHSQKKRSSKDVPLCFLFCSHCKPIYKDQAELLLNGNMYSGKQTTTFYNDAVQVSLCQC